MSGQKPVFVQKVTVIPAEWANAVGDLVYDVFNLPKTINDVKRRLGLATLAYQSASMVEITGGNLNNVKIGASQPSTGNFTEVTLSGLTPRLPSHATSKQYVDAIVAQGIAALRWQDMAQQRSNSVSITGGGGTFDTLRVRGAPQLLLDVLTLGWANVNLTPLVLQGLITNPVALTTLSQALMSSATPGGISAAIAATMPKTGGIFTGPISLASNALTALQPVPLQQVTALIEDATSTTVGNAPTSQLNIGVPTTVVGGSIYLLSNPVLWAEVLVGGVVYVTPLYLPGT